MSAATDSLEDLLERRPSPAAQQRVLDLLQARVEPLRARHELQRYEVAPGLRLRSLWGRCELGGGRVTPRVLVRCTRMDAPLAWRTPGSMTATLLHEVAHLKRGGHTPRFWALYHRLLADAVSLGALEVTDVDLGERARGDEKLAGSVLDVVAEKARAQRRTRAAANREAARRWSVGSHATLALRRGALAGVAVQVVAVARGWVTVKAPSGLLYRVAASALRSVES